MKATIFYLTSIITIALLVTDVTWTWLTMGVADMALIAWCKGNIGIRELTRLSGYGIWYRMLH